jgi:hypothetical protein
MIYVNGNFGIKLGGLLQLLLLLQPLQLLNVNYSCLLLLMINS